MNAPLRFNDALLIADQAFHPFKCVVWAPQDGSGEVSLTVLDRFSARIGRKLLPRGTCADPVQLASALQQAREELSRDGHKLQPWTMPA